MSQHDAKWEDLTDFYKQLHELVQTISEESVYFEGDNQFESSLKGKLSSNYPWVYVEFQLVGRHDLVELVRVEQRIKEMVERWGASYLGTTINKTLQCKLFAREAYINRPTVEDGS